MDNPGRHLWVPWFLARPPRGFVCRKSFGAVELPPWTLVSWMVCMEGDGPVVENLGGL